MGEMERDFWSRPEDQVLAGLGAAAEIVKQRFYQRNPG